MDGEQEAVRLAEALGDAVGFYKLGLQLFTNGGYFAVLDRLISMKKKIFADLKFFDVPETVAAAVRGIAKSGALFTTVHGEPAIMRAAAQAKGDLKILAVTMLTSLDEADLRQMGYSGSVRDLAMARAAAAKQAGCDGIICSGLEAAAMRSELGEDFLIVTPGIRPSGRPGPADHQKRVVTAADAFRNGADYIVVGRPIRDAPDPRAAALQIQQTIAQVFPS